jgi:hypothetical protein
LKSARLFLLTVAAMIAFAGNSLLCRAALKQTHIDAATFTFIRIFSGAVALCLFMNVRRRITVDRTATPLADYSETGVRFPHSILSQKEAIPSP